MKQKYGTYIVDEIIDKKVYLKCEKCHRELVVLKSKIDNYESFPCACTQSPTTETHGMSRTRTYSSWIGMKQRCYDKKSLRYKNYGGRGIKVCDRWLNSFENFLEDMGVRPDGNFTLDRVDVDGDYCPENCRWADAKTQANNMTTNVRRTYNGVTHTLKEWSEIYGIKYSLLRARIARGWDIEKALFYKKSNANTTKQIGKNKKYVSEYNIWVHMKNRCGNPNNPRFNDYGGRGIKVCDRWLHSFENFLEDMGEKPSPKYSLDRIDVNGDYCPENCRWADDKTQANNTTRNVYIEYNGVKKTAKEWEDELGIHAKTIIWRYNQGWAIEDVLCVKDKRFKDVNINDNDLIEELPKRDSRMIDMTGYTKNHITVIEFAEQRMVGKAKKNFWRCKCDCGKEFLAEGSEIRTGHVTSCGCGIGRMEKLNAHKMNKTLEYRSWNNMKQVCDNKNNPSYKNYGGKGISYSEDWADFRNFYADMGKRPVKSAKLERIDKTKNFTKDNCYWKRK